MLAIEQSELTLCIKLNENSFTISWQQNISAKCWHSLAMKSFTADPGLWDDASEVVVVEQIGETNARIIFQLRYINLCVIKFYDKVHAKINKGIANNWSNAGWQEIPTRSKGHWLHVLKPCLANECRARVKDYREYTVCIIRSSEGYHSGTWTFDLSVIKWLC